MTSEYRATPTNPIPRRITIHDILSDLDIFKAQDLYKSLGMSASDAIRVQLIEPNMTEIQSRLGECSAQYLAYLVLYCLSEAERRIVHE